MSYLWVESLPLVLLDVRTAVKDDLKCSVAEIVYRTTLRLPGESAQPDALSDPLSYDNALKYLMHQLQYSTPRPPTNPPLCVHKDLNDSTHVFFRKDSRKPPLQPTYEGPFEVIERKTRHFVIARETKRANAVSLETMNTLAKHFTFTLSSIANLTRARRARS